MERGVCSAQRMTGELPSPQSETRHHAAAAPACATMQQQHARQPQQTGTSAHSPLGTAHRADCKLAHTTSALQSTLQFTSAGELLTHSVLHTSALPRVRTPPREPSVVCAVCMNPALHACCSFCAKYSLPRFPLHAAHFSPLLHIYYAPQAFLCDPLRPSL